MKRFTLAYVVPTVALLAWFALPLARGERTLVLRDVLNSHLNLKTSQAEAMREGSIPLVDIYRAGGQPLAGNPNAVPFYPDNLLYLVASPLWSLNAHFWLHLLLAPFAFYWMARAFGLGREGAWAGAVAWTFSGFFLSHLNFYNLVAGVAWAPAFVAAGLRLGRGHDGERGQRWMPTAIAVLWALLLVAGDPLMALLTLGLGGTAFLFRGGRPRFSTCLLFAAALVVGSLLAAPQLVEFRRILPLSFRGYQGYTAEVATFASWDPRQIIEWLVPFFFGRPDRLGAGGFWGHRYFTDVVPYYWSLYPGLLTLAFVAASGRPRGRVSLGGWWAWGWIATGIFLALGRFNPLIAWIFDLGKGSFRYPVKFWLPIAVGAALLAGIGYERWLARSTADSESGRGFRIALALLALFFVSVWIYLAFFPAASETWVAWIVGKRPKGFVANERLRWMGLCLFSWLALAVVALVLRLTRKRAALGGAILLALHSGLQLFFLDPLVPTDQVAPYLANPKALAYVPAGSRVVSGSFLNLFHKTKIEQGDFPEPNVRWLERRAFAELYPFTGPQHHLRYELNVSPEGLDSFLTRMAHGAIKASKDPERIRLLACWAVDRLLIDRAIHPSAESQVELLAELPSFGRTLYIYAIRDTAPRAFLAQRTIEAPHMNAGLRVMLDPEFDPRSDAMTAAKGGDSAATPPTPLTPTATRPVPQPLGGGTVRVLADERERFAAEVESVGPGFLVVQRASLPIYKATIDGKPANLEVANLHRLGLRVPAGQHAIEIATDRTPLVHASWAAAFGLGLLPLLVGIAGSRRERQSPPNPPQVVEEDAK